MRSATRLVSLEPEAAPAAASGAASGAAAGAAAGALHQPNHDDEALCWRRRRAPLEARVRASGAPSEVLDARHVAGQLAGRWA